MRLIKYHSVSPAIYMDFVEITHRHDFEQEINTLRERLNITDTDSITGQDNTNIWINLLESSELNNDIRNILEKLDIDPKFLNWVHTYLVLGWQWNPNDIHYDETGIKTIENEDGKIIVEIGPNSTREDYIRTWDNQIKKHVSTFKRKPKNKFWRNLKIFEMVNAGMSIDQIYTHTKTEFEDDLDYSTIKKIYSDMCIQLRVPKNNRKVLRTKRSEN